MDYQATVYYSVCISEGVHSITESRIGHMQAFPLEENPWLYHKLAGDNLICGRADLHSCGIIFRKAVQVLGICHSLVILVQTAVWHTHI